MKPIKLVDKLKAENERLKFENGNLRAAARQLMEGLTQYAKEENWEEMGGPDEAHKTWWWKGGDEGLTGGAVGPKTARYFLGLENEEQKN